MSTHLRVRPGQIENVPGGDHIDLPENAVIVSVDAIARGEHWTVRYYTVEKVDDGAENDS